MTMRWFDSHISDHQLLSEADGELSPREAKRVERHLASCWTCRARKQEIENTVGDFVRSHHEALDAQLPEPAGPRALLQARLAALSDLSPEAFPWTKVA